MNIGKLKFSSKSITFNNSVTVEKISACNITQGISMNDDFIFCRNKNHLKVFDRICDHKGGKLISREGKTICPLHGWEFNPVNGDYVNVECRKEPIFDSDIGALETVELLKKHLSRDRSKFKAKKDLNIRYLNHACLIVETEDLKFATDPWLIGPAFSNGWWLSRESPLDAFEELNSCDFVFISHNHPDHLHAETLRQVRADMIFITPDFQSGSTKIYLRDLGFRNVLTLTFSEVLVCDEKEIALSVLKSGDFRDDSGLMFEVGDFCGIFTVDCNYIDFWRFPETVDLLASSFANGATGFPLCFDNYSESEKKLILTRNRNAGRATNQQMLEIAQPKFYLPYAGYFSEKAKRDAYVQNNNLKNSVEDYEKICADLNIELINPIEFGCLQFSNGHLSKRRDTAERFATMNPEEIIGAEIALEVADKEIRNYFIESSFSAALDLRIILSNEDYSVAMKYINVHFSADSPPTVNFHEVISKHQYNNFLQITVRENEFYKIITRGLPWEDLSIGFQCRIIREPNVYNSSFWYHFTNVYVSDRVSRRSQNCGACLRIEHNLY